ncbi:MAG: CAP domain-containing protein [Pseudomonadota bacterium]
MRIHHLSLLCCLLLIACNDSNDDDQTESSENSQEDVSDNGGQESRSDGVSSSSDCEIPEEQELMLELVNQARSQQRRCGDESMDAVELLTWNCELADAAVSHSEDMATVNFFSHTGSDGLSVADRVSNAGYSWSRVGENIAVGQRTVEVVMEGWLDSPGHCRNIMNSGYTHFGSSRVDTDAADYPVYWTQVFATPR